MAPSDDLPTLAYNNVTAWRYSNYDTPFWARENTRAGRWNAEREAAVQYLTLDPDGAWAELIRAENLRTENEVALVRMPIWVAALNVAGLVDYSTFEGAEAAGFSAEALIDDDWERCQHEGARLRDLGYGGVVSPSAALAGSIDVTLFGPRILWSWGSVPVLASAIPATVAAIGSPPDRLVERVRLFGTEHAGYAEFARIEAVRTRGSRQPGVEPGSSAAG